MVNDVPSSTRQQSDAEERADGVVTALGVRDAVVLIGRTLIYI